MPTLNNLLLNDKGHDTIVVLHMDKSERKQYLRLGETDEFICENDMGIHGWSGNICDMVPFYFEKEI